MCWCALSPSGLLEGFGIDLLSNDVKSKDHNTEAE
jgi:hypothetical protein